jgi:hypothetical protein
MMRRLSGWLIGWALVLGAVSNGAAEPLTLKLSNGQEVTGEVLSANNNMVMVKKAEGFEPVAWKDLTTDAIKLLATIPATKRQAEQWLEVLEEAAAPEKPPPPEIKFREPPRLDRPDPKAGFGIVFSSTLGVVLFLLLYAANLYGAYEVSLFRNYHPALVCGLAAVAPVLTQIVFLCLPTQMKKAAEEHLAWEAPPEGTADAEAAVVEAAPDEAGGVAPGPSAPAQAPATVYERGNYTFNRRFFETKMAGFLRVVPSEAEKDMVIDVIAARGEYLAQRISRVMPNDVVLLLCKGGASSEVTVPYTEIRAIKIRHKDA